MTTLRGMPIGTHLRLTGAMAEPANDTKPLSPLPQPYSERAAAIAWEIAILAADGNRNHRGRT